MYNDMMVALNRTPGFLDRYQAWVFRYPTGITFLRSAALLRADLRDVKATLDPQSHDMALRNMVLIGYSMGGLLSKLQVTSSGDRIWSAAATRPLDSLVTTEQTRGLLRESLLLRAVPMIRRVIFIATPHDGSPVASTLIGQVRDSRGPAAFRLGADDRPDQPRQPRCAATVPAPPCAQQHRCSGRRRFLCFPPCASFHSAPGVTLHTIAGYGIHHSDRRQG